MRDPYEVLGVPGNVSTDEIKKAYRALSRKYHPDANMNNPNKDQAEAKFKEIQQAYEQIMNEKNGTGSYGANGSYGQSSAYGYGPFGDFGGYGRQQNSQNYSQEDNYLRAAANYIQNGYYKEALNILGQMENRNSLWYYYSAQANHGAGNNMIALEHARQALAMEPNNWQYQILVNQLEGGGGWYQSQQRTYTMPGAGMDYCTKLCLLNLACNACCGGNMCCGPMMYF